MNCILTLRTLGDQYILLVLQIKTIDLLQAHLVEIYLFLTFETKFIEYLIY
jgi:hypothetical protein